MQGHLAPRAVGSRSPGTSWGFFLTSRAMALLLEIRFWHHFSSSSLFGSCTPFSYPQCCPGQFSHKIQKISALYKNSLISNGCRHRNPQCCSCASPVGNMEPNYGCMMWWDFQHVLSGTSNTDDLLCKVMLIILSSASCWMSAITVQTLSHGSHCFISQHKSLKSLVLNMKPSWDII